jgi:hypothetical protein
VSLIGGSSEPSFFELAVSEVLGGGDGEAGRRQHVSASGVELDERGPCALRARARRDVFGRGGCLE